MRLGLLLLLGATVRAEGDEEEEESNIIELSADNFSDVTSDDDWKPWAVHFSSGAAESKGAQLSPGGVAGDEMVHRRVFGEGGEGEVAFEAIRPERNGVAIRDAQAVCA